VPTIDTLLGKEGKRGGKEREKNMAKSKRITFFFIFFYRGKGGGRCFEWNVFFSSLVRFSLLELTEGKKKKEGREGGNLRPQAIACGCNSPATRSWGEGKKKRKGGKKGREQGFPYLVLHPLYFSAGIRKGGEKEEKRREEKGNGLTSPQPYSLFA